MLNETELTRIMQNLKLTPDGRAVVAHIRASQPARRVDSGAGNVACRYPSKKMRCIIQAESHKNELAAVYLWDHDLVTHEFYDQPPKIKLNYVDATGKRRGHFTTPDYFVIQDGFIGWVECKTEEWLQQQEQKHSTLYVRASDGSWECPAGTALAAEYGLGFKLRSSSENPWILIRNLTFLSDYWEESVPSEYEQQKTSLISCFGDHSWRYLTELLADDSGADSDTLYQAIARDDLCVNLGEELLAEPESTKVYRNRIVADACRLRSQAVHRTLDSANQPNAQIIRMQSDEKIDWDGATFTIKTASERSVFLEDAHGKMVSLQREQFETLVKQGVIKGMSTDARELQSLAEQVVCSAAPSDLGNAVRRYRLLQQIEDDPAARIESVSDRTLRHWKQLRRNSEAIHGDGFVGLISRTSHRGNSTRKIDDQVLETMRDVIETDFKGADAKSKTVCYGMLRARCKDLSLIPPSEKTFRREIRRAHSNFETTSAREGARAAYKLEPFIYVLDRSTPRHGDRAFEIAHIDHTELDLQFVGSKFGEQLKRPWLTVMLDAYSRSVLAFVLTFDPPSYRSCMLVMRECIRRHSRAPATLVLDRGNEFESSYFETLLARLGTMKKSRPPQKPRFGSIMERFFGISNTQLVHNLRGNNKHLQTPRQMSSTHDPRNRAVWTLAEFIPKFEHFVYDIYGNLDHSALGVSPNSALKTSLAKTGLRAMRLVPFTPELALLCLPSTPKGTAKINPAKGVKIGYLYYRHPTMRDHKYADVDVPIKYDPFDLSTAFAYIGDMWRKCTSELANIFEGRTEREIATIAGEINGKNKLTGERRAITAETIARFIMQMEGTEVTLLQQKRDGEFRLAHTGGDFNFAGSGSADDPIADDLDESWSNLSTASFGVFK